MQTDMFLLNAVKKTTPEPGLIEPGESEAVLARRVRANWRVGAVGPNTLKVSYRCRVPDFCVQFINAVLSDFRDEVSGAQMNRKSKAVAFFEQQVRSAQENLRTMVPNSPERDVARDVYERLLPRLIEAQVEEAVARQSGPDQFRVISPAGLITSDQFLVILPAGFFDTPVVPLRAVAFPVLLGLLAGLALMLTSILVAMWTDRGGQVQGGAPGTWQSASAVRGAAIEESASGRISP
jgi:hypothetical protein